MLDGVGEFVDRERPDVRLHDVDDGGSRWRRLPGRGGGCAEQPVERPDEPIVRVVIVGLAAVAGNALSAHSEPDELLFRDGDAVYELSGSEEIAAAEAAFVDHVFGIDLGVV